MVDYTKFIRTLHEHIYHLQTGLIQIKEENNELREENEEILVDIELLKLEIKELRIDIIH